MKYVINELILGKNRTLGYDIFDSESKEFIGMTEKQIKDYLEVNKLIRGLMLDKDGTVIVDTAFCKNIMQKSGINTLTPKSETDNPVNLVYTVVGRISDTEYEVVSSRYARKDITVGKVRAFHEIGALNGVSLDEAGNVTLYEENVSVAADLEAKALFYTA